jgi:HK97 family phage major capsid protein
MAYQSDAMLARLQSELEERRAFQDGLVEAAQNEARDLTETELELYGRARDRMRTLEVQMEPLRDAARIAAESKHRTTELQQQFAMARNPAAAKMEYRSAGAYINDVWAAGLGGEDARQRLEIYTRVAAHQTVPDNLGVIPEPIVGDVVNFIDASRPIVSALGVRGVPGGRFTRPKVTQHTNVGPQATEKTELVSQKMLITRVQVLMATYGGYVNVSRQDIDWSVPSIMDIVVQDLAAQYAIETEAATATALETAATTGPTIPTGPADADAVLSAIWTAAASAWTATQGVGRLILAVPPDMLGMIGPLFPPYNPTNAGGLGFSAAGFGSGQVGTISGIAVVMSTALTAGSMLLVNSAAAEVYEQRVGSLQVTEPSVLGVQVAYAGYFAPIVLEAAGVVSIVKTP